MATRILIVGEHNCMPEALGPAFKDESWQVARAWGKGEALERVVAGEPDLVVLAAEMTAEDERGFVRDLREVSGTALIIIAAGRDVERRVRSLRLGADDYMGRPLRLEELKARIQAILRRMSTVA